MVSWLLAGGPHPHHGDGGGIPAGPRQADSSSWSWLHHMEMVEAGPRQADSSSWSWLHHGDGGQIPGRQTLAESQFI